MPPDGVATPLQVERRQVDPRLGHWLAALRRSLSPDHLVSSPCPRRRAGWLTQVDVARLSGLTARAYQAVEQGFRVPGPRVFDGIAAALQMTPAQVAYMRLLANSRCVEPRPVLAADEVQALVDSYREPAVAYDHAWQVLTCNSAFRSAFPAAASGGNLLLWHFTMDARRLFVDWSEQAAELVARLRLMHARFADSTLLESVVAQLVRMDAYARTLWEAGIDVGAEPSCKTYQLRSPAGNSYCRTVVQLLPAGAVDLSQRLSVWLPQAGEP